MDTSAIEFETVLAQAEALAQSDPHSALSMLEAIPDTTDDQDPATLARRHYLQARLLVNAGEPRAALRHIDAARDNWQACGQVLRALRSDLGRMNVLDDLGQHRQAAAVGRQLLATIDALDPQTFGDDIAEATWLRAAAGENLAVALGYLGEHAAALHSHLETEAAYAELGLNDDVARSWANQGLQLLELGRVDEAAQVLRTAAEHFEAVDDRLSQGRALAFLSRAELRSGHIVAARATIDLAKRSLAGLQKSPTWAQLQIELAEACCTLGLLDEAEEAQTSVIESFADNSRSPERIQALLNRGITRLAGGRPHDAAPDLQQAVDGYVELGDPVGQARSLVALSRAGEGVTALASARHALALLDTTHPADLAEALVRTAECELDPTSAAAALDRARDVAAGLAMPALDWQIRTCAGRLARAGGDLAAALEHFEAAHEITSTQRSNLAFELHRVGFLASRAQVVEELVATLLENGEVDRALDIIGTDRSQTLTDRLHGRIDAVTAMHSHELDAIYSGLLTAPQTEAAALVRRARRFETPLSRPATAKPRRSARNAAVAQVVIQTVGADLFAFVDGAAGVRTARLAPVLDVAREVERLGAIRRRAMNSELADRHGAINQAIGAEVLASLSEMLIDPLVELFGGRLPSDMQIVPDASVAGVPFAAVSDAVTISMSPGFEAADTLRARARPLHKTLVVATNDPLAPATSVEARAIASTSPDHTSLVGDAATADAVLAAVAQHDVVHLACHGLFRADNPWFSALRLADRWLSAAEFGDAFLDGQLVVLSACHSGAQASPGSRGELIGLPHALLAAGASAVVVNMWEADDACSALLMSAFHKNLSEGHETALALSLARRAVRQTHPDVHQWANPTLIGAHDQRMEQP